MGARPRLATSQAQLLVSAHWATFSHHGYVNGCSGALCKPRMSHPWLAQCPSGMTDKDWRLTLLSRIWHRENHGWSPISPSRSRELWANGAVHVANDRPSVRLRSLYGSGSLSMAQYRILNTMLFVQICNVKQMPTKYYFYFLVFKNILYIKWIGFDGNKTFCCSSRKKAIYRKSLKNSKIIEVIQIFKNA